tara:strand:+ start:381 stop:563 length:183 start_codon:yes stop_codon:yes gene_type:complete
MKKGKKISPIKNRKHKKIVNDYKRSKENHLEKLANKMLKDDEKNKQLKQKIISTNFLNLF